MVVLSKLKEMFIELRVGGKGVRRIGWPTQIRKYEFWVCGGGGNVCLFLKKFKNYTSLKKCDSSMLLNFTCKPVFSPTKQRLQGLIWFTDKTLINWIHKFYHITKRSQKCYSSLN